MFVNPFVFQNYSAKRAFEKKWKVSFRKTKETLFRDFYYKVFDEAEFTNKEIQFVEEFSLTMLASSSSTATKVEDSWNGFCETYHVKLGTTRGKIIKLYTELIRDIKQHGTVTLHAPIIAAEIVDAFAWLFHVEAEEVILDD